MSSIPGMNPGVHWLVLLFIFSITSTALVAEEPHLKKTIPESISLSEVLEKARANDLSLARFDINARAFGADAHANAYLPDPVLFAGIQSIPTDTFDLDQEPMTQLRFGIRQMFPQGDTLSIQQDLSGINAEMESVRKKSYWLKLKLNTESAWLEAWYWQKNTQLIEDDRVFLTQVYEFIQSMYQIGARNQSDLIGAELALIKLDEKQIESKRNFQKFRHRLNTLANEKLRADQLSDELALLRKPELNMADSDLLIKHFITHPDIQILAQQADFFGKKVDLTEQDFEPAWGVELSYGLRDGDNMDGSDRADFLSAGISVQLPLFTQGKQNQSLDAARFRQSAVENQRLEALQKMHFQFQNVYQQYLIAVDQRLLYEQEILPVLARQRESALQSYEADRGDFRTVTDLFSKEQSAKIKHQRLRVNEQLMMAQINYWLDSDSGDLTHNTLTERETAQ